MFVRFQIDASKLAAKSEASAPIDAQADIVVDTSVGSHEQSADQVLDALAQYQDTNAE